MKSKCGKNKTAAHESRVECRIALPHFDVGCDQSFRVSTKRIRNYSPSFSMSGSFVQQNFNSYRSDHHSVNSSNLVSRVSHLTLYQSHPKKSLRSLLLKRFLKIDSLLESFKNDSKEFQMLTVR